MYPFTPRFRKANWLRSSQTDGIKLFLVMFLASALTAPNPLVVTASTAKCSASAGCQRNIIAMAAAPDNR